MQDIRKYIRNAIIEALPPVSELEQPVEIEIPRSPEHGDLSTNIAMRLSRPLKKAPRVIAEELIERLKLSPDMVEKVDIAGAGFINFTYSKQYLRNLTAYILKSDDSFGSSDIGEGKRVNLEFVSANPTGPLNVVSARAAALGDSLKRLLNFSGFRTESEFYVNDAGQQNLKLIFSFLVRYAESRGEQGLSLPENGYYGDYLIRLAEEFEIPKNSTLATEWKHTLEDIRRGDFRAIPDDLYNYASNFVLERIRSSQEETLAQFGVHFDKWVRESEIRKKRDPRNFTDELISQGFAYESDGAIYFKTSQFGDDEDRVIWTSDDRPTYFLPDIAYHLDKYHRGFEWLIDIWGPDHHGYVPRMKAALQALGHNPQTFTVIIAQQVNLVRGAEKVKMSKRAGEIIEMQELIDEVGSDAARFFFLQRKSSAHLDFDLDLAVQQSEENPVFYVQYAHARICSIKRYAREAGITGEPDFRLLEHPAEFQLIRKMSQFPLIIELCIKNLEPQRITVYLGELASSFHRFYQQCRVVTEDVELSRARLNLCLAVKQVLKNGLYLLGVSAPERM